MRFFVLAAAAACLIAYASFADAEAEATIIIPKTLRELAAESERVVVAEVVSQRADWLNGDQTTLIYTHTTLKVSESLKGGAIESLTVSEVGGTVGEVTCACAGMPTFRPGERVLLFLYRDVLGFWRTSGLIQGKFPIVRDMVAKEDIVRLGEGLEHVWKGSFEAWQISKTKTVLAEDMLAKAKELIALTAKKETKK